MAAHAEVGGIFRILGVQDYYFEVLKVEVTDMSTLYSSELPIAGESCWQVPESNVISSAHKIQPTNNEKSAQRDANCALAVV